jgi:hypothetical protein
MNTLVGPRAADKGRLFGIVGIRFGDRTSRDESLKQVTFDCFLVMRPATSISAVSLQLRSSHTNSCIPRYPVPEYPIKTATFFLGLLSSAFITSSENFVA